MERGGEKWAANEKLTTWGLDYANIEAFFLSFSFSSSSWYLTLSGITDASFFFSFLF